GQVLHVGGHARLRADVLQRPLDGSKVAHAVVHYRDHPSSPFDEGTPSPLTATAWRSARPSALKPDSAMWWRLRPRMRSTCSVAPAWIENARHHSSSVSDSSAPIAPSSGTL